MAPPLTPPSGGIDVPPQWMTFWGAWYIRDGTIAGPNVRPSFAKGGVASASFFAPGTNAYWEVYPKGQGWTDIKLFIDNIDQQALSWDNGVAEGSPFTGGKVINATTAYGWHNWTIQVTCEPAVELASPTLYTEGKGKGSYTPAEDDEIKQNSEMYVPDWLSFGDRNQWRYTDTLSWKAGWVTNVTDQSMTIRPPKGTAHALARSVDLSSNAHAAYTVTISPDPVNGPSSRSYRATGNFYWRDPLFLADLDPKKQHEIKVTHDGGGEIGIHSVSFTKPKSQLKVILPAVFVPVLVIAALVGVWWWRRRRRLKALMAPPQGPRLLARDMRSELFVIDPTNDSVRVSPLTNAHISPYPMGSAPPEPVTTTRSSSETSRNRRLPVPDGEDNYAVDGGPVPVREQLPPRYNPEWSGTARHTGTRAATTTQSSSSAKRETP